MCLIFGLNPVLPHKYSYSIFFRFTLIWHVFFYPLTFSLCVLTQSESLIGSVYVGLVFSSFQQFENFSPFAFKVIVDMYSVAILLIIWGLFCSFPVPFSFWFLSLFLFLFCGLVTLFSGMLRFLSSLCVYCRFSLCCYHEAYTWTFTLIKVHFKWKTT